MPSTDVIVLDTHVLLWWQAGGERLSAAARRVLDDSSRIAICPITFWEVSMLNEKGRIALDRPAARWANDLLADPRIEATELTPTIAATAGTLADFHGDPADRLIYTTTLALDAPLVTKDRALRDFAKRDGRATTIW